MTMNSKLGKRISRIVYDTRYIDSYDDKGEFLSPKAVKRSFQYVGDSVVEKIAPKKSTRLYKVKLFKDVQDKIQQKANIPSKFDNAAVFSRGEDQNWKEYQINYESSSNPSLEKNIIAYVGKGKFEGKIKIQKIY